MAEYSGSRIVWLDPNMSDNKMVNLEDLSIKVEFTAERKGRSIIYSGNQTKNTAGTNSMVNFIEGSRVDDSEQKSLTTRYTEAIALEVMNKKEQEDDFESLGIESIDIEFNSAYTPVVKIKFIDVRGNAILSHGNLSKYRMFFELPYPIFKLSVKGFYGKTVNYCLHMLRWNASFNSETGNFEIQADFIGYTYALLTDLLLGLVRAAVRTGKGQQKLKSKQDDYGDNSNLIITIDDLILRFATLSENLRKIDSEDNTASQLQTYDDIYDGISQIRTRVNSLSTTIYDGTTPNNYFRSDDGQILAVPTTERDRINTEIETYNNDIKTTASSVNGKIGNGGLKFNDDKLTDIVIIKDLLKKELTEGDPVDTIINKSGVKYNGEAGKEWVKQLLTDLGTLGNSSLDGETKMDVYNLKRPYNEINDKEKKIKENQTQSTDEFGKKLIAKAESVIGFKPSIRNIFRVLTVNSEIFLEVLRDVSVSAETSTVRAAEFKKISGNINVNETTVNGGTIYPWPEYRKEKNGEPGYSETYLGTETIINPLKIDEVVFTEEMLKRLMEVAKFDKDLDNLAAGEDINNSPFSVEYPWYPVTAIDTPVTPNMTENPYTEPVNSNKKDEVLRLLIMRSFLLCGFGAYNNKILSSSPRLSSVYLHGKLEAENFIETCRRFGRNGQGLANLVSTSKDSTTSDVQTLTKETIELGLKGSKEITNAPFKPGSGIAKAIMILTDLEGNQLEEATNNGLTQYIYTYHFNSDNLSYIPVNKGFSGSIFYGSDGKFKRYSNLEDTAGDFVFVNKKRNQPHSIFSMYNRGQNTNEGDTFWLKDNLSKNTFEANVDGAKNFSIIEYADYNASSMKPSFGQDILTEFDELQKSASNATGGSVEPVLQSSSVLEALIDPANKKSAELGQILKNLNTVGVNKTNGYSWLEFDLMNLDGTYDDADLVSEFKPKGLEDGISYPAILSYYTQFDGDSDFQDFYIGAYFSRYLNFNDNETKEFLQKKSDGFTYYKKELGEYDKPQITNKNRRPWNKNDYTKQKQLINEKLTNNAKIYLPFIEFGTSFISKTNITKYVLSLFGSWLYNQQNDLTIRGGVMTAKAAKGLLFLHSIPWQGVRTFSTTFGLDLREYLMFDNYNDWTNDNSEYYKTKIRTIKGLFQGNGGFIHAPKAWTLFIGGMLYRARYLGESDIIKFEDILGNQNNILISENSRNPNRGEYLYTANISSSETNWNTVGMCFGDNIGDYGGDGDTYTPIDRSLLFLPWEVQKIFIDYFVNWVNDESTGFGYIQKELEIWRGYDKGNIYNGMYDEFVKITDGIKALTTNSEEGKKINMDGLSTASNEMEVVIPKNVVDNYDLISCGFKLGADEKITQVTLINKQDTPIMNHIVGLLTEPVILQNGNPTMWNHELDVKSSTSKDSITVRDKQMTQYLDGFYTRLLELNAEYSKEDIPDADDEIQQEVFGTTNDNEIKLMIYRTLSSINDKWLNGSKTQNVFVQCGTNNVNRKDLAVAKKYRAEATEPSLIDTFRFVDRSLADIGDKFFINIDGVVDLIRYNYNQSLFDVVNKILVDNNFNFIPLPSFVNFNNIDELKTVFSAYTYNDKTAFEGTGPSFVCVYVGQTSVNLDLGVDSVYPDDGLSLSIDSTGNVPLDDQTADFNTQYVESNGDLMVPVFAVNYGQQNQNFFRSVKLDQREFAETMESLQVIESLSQGGDKSSPSYAGNNLFNVYKTRSYSAEVEMLGNPMIQPMMYFQLNNIPMFRGAYLIYKVNHSIKPNSMTTTFKGNRVKKAKTPLMEESAMYLNIVNSGTGGASITSTSQQSGNFPPIVRTIIDNGGTNGNVESGYIKLVPFNVPAKAYISPDIPNERRKMITEAAPALVEMLKAFVKFAEENNYPKKDGNYIGVTSLYRSIEYQTKLYNDNIKRGGQPGAVATPGYSNHSWGIAVDLYFLPQKSGQYLKENDWAPISTAASKEGFDLTYNPSLKWFLDNSYVYGFVIPYSLRDQTGVQEYWHFEYHGTSAKCIAEKNPRVYAHTMDTSRTVNTSIVKNPKTPEGVEAVYTECDYKFVKIGDGADITGFKSTSDSGFQENQLKVKKYFKNKGLSKEAVAGIMGNIQQESKFDPSALNPSDSNGLPSYGLIQWNANTATQAQVGSTVESQLEYLIVFGGRYDNYINKLIELRDSGNKADAAEAAYQFANIVERCGGCTGTSLKDGAEIRAEYANDFFKRFNTAGDLLKW
jgi:LAS superfamily LD-carboxypeptidase LdcB